MLDKGDILIDGGNTNFRDTIRRYNDAERARASTFWMSAPAAASGA